MAIDFSLCNSNNMQCPGPQHWARQMLLTTGRIGQGSDPTRGQLYADMNGPTPVYVISELYYPVKGKIAINVMSRGQFFRLQAYLPEVVGSEKAYRVTDICALTSAAAIQRSRGELESRLAGRTAGIVSASHQSSQTEYKNSPSDGQNADNPSSGQYANNPSGGQYANAPSPYGVLIPA